MQSILGKEQAPKERSWERVNQWLKNVESQQAHQRAVATTHLSYFIRTLQFHGRN